MQNCFLSLLCMFSPFFQNTSENYVGMVFADSCGLYNLLSSTNYFAGHCLMTQLCLCKHSISSAYV